MANVFIEESTMSAIGNAIRSKTGKSDLILPVDMPSEIEGILVGDGDNLADAMINKSITEITSNVTTIGSNAFTYCYELTTVNFPAATTIGSYSFGYCEALTTANFPNVTNIGAYAFEKCKKLTTASFPIASETRGYTFTDCYELTTVSFPVIATISSYMFRQCRALTTVSFPNVTKIGTYAFNSCYSLTRMILRSETLCTLSDSNAFGNCYHLHGTKDTTYNPDGLKDCYIYVPRALIEDYKVATNWSDFATQFRALEDYTVDGTITGELDESKI